MRAARDTQEAALAEARSAAEQARERWTAEVQAALKKAKEAWKAEEAQRFTAARAEWQKEARAAKTTNTFAKAVSRQHRARIARRLVAGGALAAAVAAAVAYYPRVEPTVVEKWWPKVGQIVTTGIDPLLDKAGVLLGVQSAPEPLAERRAVIDVDLAKVRAGPSTGTAVITSLTRDERVTEVERRGYWVLVHFGGGNGKQAQQGWVYGSLLKDAAGP